MSIQTAIENAQTKVANAYNSVSTMGGTLPATKNLFNLPMAIESIPTGDDKYGLYINNIVGNTDTNGILQYPLNTRGDIIFTGITDISDKALDHRFYRLSNITKGVQFPSLTVISGSEACHGAFYECTSLTSISFPNLQTISGSGACYNIFHSCTSLTSISFPNLQTISGSDAFRGAFYGCSSLTSISFPNLQTISGLRAYYQVFYNCTSLTSASFPKLQTLSENSCMAGCFVGCRSITDIYFPALTTTSFGSIGVVSQFQALMTSTGNNIIHTIHFPSNMETTISTLTGYPLFGGTSGYVVLSFDLPATE